MDSDDGHADEVTIGRTVAAYDQAAPHYRESTREFDRYPGLEAELLSFLAGLSAGPVLDLGAGGGRDSAFIRAHGRDVVALDRSTGLLRELGRQDRRFAGLSLAGDLRALPVRTGSVAGVLCSGALLHIPRSWTEPCLAEMARVMDRTGLASISMKEGDGGEWVDRRPDIGPRWFEYFAVGEFVGLCRSAGLRVCSVLGRRRRRWFSVIVARQ